MQVLKNMGNYSRYIYYSYLTVLAFFLVSLIFFAGIQYVAIMAVAAAAFGFIQSSANDRVLLLLLKSIIVASVGVVFFIRTFPIGISPLLTAFSNSFSGGMGLFVLGFAILGTLSKKSIFPNDQFNGFKNFVVIGLMLLCAFSLFNTLFFPLKMLVVTDKLSAIIVSFISWGVPLTLMFGFNHVLGRNPEDLLGYKTLSLKEFLMYFLLGIIVVCLADIISTVVLPLFFSNEVVLLAINVVNWDTATYFLYQSITMVLVLIQTAVEEIAFRSMLYAVFSACGFGEDATKEGSRSQIIIAFIMSAWFAFAHLANPVENGRAFASIFEKFLVYSINISYSMAYMLTGNIALSWGMHFMHNYQIAMRRFSFSAMDNGFFQYNVYESSMTSSEVMQESVVKMAVGIMLVVGAHYYAEHVKNLGKFDSIEDGQMLKVAV